MHRFADELDLAQFHTDQAIEHAIAAIRHQSTKGEGRRECVDCGTPIPAARLIHVPNANRCCTCQDQFER